MYKFGDAPSGPSIPATILFSGTAHTAAREAVTELAEHYDVAAELWSATSYKALREEALAAERWNRLHPSQEPKVPRVAQILADSQGPIVAVSDFMKIVPEQVQRFVPDRTFVPLGTDGMGRSDTREALRRHFEVDTGHVVLAVLDGLLADGKVDESVVEDAISRYDIDPEAIDPYWS
jgi:pyruvate dehydrogenase E1 component